MIPIFTSCVVKPCPLLPKQSLYSFNAYTCNSVCVGGVPYCYPKKERYKMGLGPDFILSIQNNFIFLVSISAITHLPNRSLQNKHASARINYLFCAIVSRLCAISKLQCLGSYQEFRQRLTKQSGNCFLLDWT